MSILVLDWMSRMRASFNSTVLRGNLVLAIAGVAIAWSLAVPGFLTLSNLVGLTGLLAVLAWVWKTTTHSNAQPASSLVQAPHAAAVARGRTTKTL